MPLEATMMLIDNSEYMRNGDYLPDRFDAQSDAVTSVFQSKTDSNPENTVGVMTMAGKSPEVLVTHTRDQGQVLSALHKSSSTLSGSADISTAISVAQLALKHRTNKNLRQRIIVFVGSPLAETADEKNMVKLAKKLKKNNVAVDVVSLGEDESRNTNDVILRAFVEAANSSENSHFVTVPAGRMLGDAVVASPILAGEGAAADVAAAMDGVAGEGGAAAAGNQFEFGVDPSMDPELAMALRMSMEEERARQTATGGASSSAPAGTSGSNLETIPENAAPATDSSATANATTAPRVDTIPGAETEDEEERLLAQAIAMSTQHEADIEMQEEDTEMDEDEEIQRAIQMSMEAEENEDKNDKK